MQYFVGGLQVLRYELRNSKLNRGFLLAGYHEERELKF